MNSFLRILPLKRGIIVTLILLLFANIFSFYGLYTHKFYIFKIQNYLIPIASVVHVIFLYVLWFKNKEKEIGDPQMKQLEYWLYATIPVYAYKLIATINVVSGASQYSSHNIPATFLPMGKIMIIVYSLLILSVLLAVFYRKYYVGNYNFEELNQADSWE